MVEPGAMPAISSIACVGCAIHSATAGSQRAQPGAAFSHADRIPASCFGVVIGTSVTVVLL
jgi:hypothetical protein